MSNTAMFRKRSEALAIALLGEQVAKQWWNSSNKAFDMKTPNQQWKQDYLTVYNYLMDQGYGR